MGRADGRLHDGLLGAGHRGALVAGGRGRGTTIGRKGMILAARVLAATAWDLFQSPEVLAAARAEHRRPRAGRPYSPCSDRTRSRRWTTEMPRAVPSRGL